MRRSGMKRAGSHWLGAALAALSLAAITFALGAPPDDPAAGAPAPAIVTRVVPPAGPEATQFSGTASFVAQSPRDPQRLTFVPAEEQVRLIAGLERIPRPGAIERLVISTIELDTPVTQIGVVRHDGEYVYETVDHVPGQYRGVNPGDGGNVVIAGHVGTRDNQGGAIFRDLHRLDLGDELDAYSNRGRFRYVVTEIRFVASTAVEVMQTSAGERLTLITCRSCNVGCQRLVVIAQPIATPQEASSA